MNVLQDQPADTPATSEQRPRLHGTAVRLGGAALIALLAFVAADRAMDLLPNWGNPLREQVIDRERPALMLALSDLNDYHAAQGSYQVVVDLERDTPYVPSIVKGERTTYLATGTVDGVVDFSALGADAVQIEGGAVTITLPSPRLGEAAIDLENSRVVSRDRGVLDRISGAFSDSPTSERDVALLAEDKLQDAAASSDLLNRAQDNTRNMLTGLARSFGYSDVTVRFDAAAGT
ncbi:MAG: DUF4230 domain-containing protein [Actinomycetota bacterium]|nr:DUF4230 domain-containing protein [Actinomycetota bacterium]